MAMSRHPKERPMKQKSFKHIKPANKPSDLRPISLTEAGGKVFAKALNNRIRPLVSEAAATWPQYAYLQSRSIDRAVARVVAHCSRVRDTIASATFSLQDRRETGRMPTNCCGGIMISIDASKAFDTSDHQVCCKSCVLQVWMQTM